MLYKAGRPALKVCGLPVPTARKYRYIQYIVFCMQDTISILAIAMINLQVYEQYRLMQAPLVP